MKKTRIRLFLLMTMVSLLATTTAFADDEGDGATPPPEGPISQAVPLLALVGVAFAYKAMSKKQLN